MTDSILTLNSSSALLNALAGGQDGSSPMSKLTDVWTHRQKYNILSTSKKIIKTEPRNQPTGNDPWGKTVNFDVQKMGMWNWAVLEVTATLNGANGTNVDNSYFAARFFSEILITAHGSTLMKLTPAAIHALIEYCPLNKSLQYKKMLNGDRDLIAVNGQVTKFYVPIFGWMFDNYYNNLYTNAIEDLMVQCTINGKTDTGLLAAGAVADCTVFLYSCYRNLTTPALNAYKSFSFKENKKMQMLAYSFENESVKALETSANTTPLTFNITAEKVVSKTFFYISNRTNTGSYGPDGTLKIKSVTVSINGDDVFQNVPIELVNFDDSLFNERNTLQVSNIGVVTNERELAGENSNVYCINWALFPDYNSYTGGVAFKGNNCSIKILTTAAPGAANTYYLNVTHMYHRVVSLEANGRLSVFDAL